MLRRLIVAGVALLAIAQSQVKDHPLVSRYQGSDVLDYKMIGYDEMSLPLGSIVDANTYTRSQRVAGKITKYKYTTPANRSVLEVFQNYHDALQRAGFQILYTCTGTECRSDKFTGGYENAPTGTWCFNCEEPMRFLAAKLARPTGAHTAVL